MTRYLDCEVRITNFNDATLRIGNSEDAGRPKLHPDELNPKLLEASVDAQSYGLELFDALFPPDDDLRTAYRAMWAIARFQGKRVRLRLHITATAPPYIHSLDWEKLFDPKLNVALGRSRNIAFSRSIGLSDNYDSAPLPLEVSKPRILLVVSNPSNAPQRGLAHLDAEQLYQLIRDSIGSLTDRVDLFDGNATREAISDRLDTGNYDTLHIHAHAVFSASEGSHLILQNDDGTADYVDENYIGQMFEDVEGLKLITLVSCHGALQSRTDPFSGLGPTLVGQRYRAVVAMRHAIGVGAGETFTKYFYEAMARTGTVDVAVNQARRQVFFANPQENPDWSAPCLFMYLPDGRLWNVPSNTGVNIPMSPVAPPSDFLWDTIVRNLRNSQVVPVIGPDINLGLVRSNQELTWYWADKHDWRKTNYPSDNRNDLPRVARYVEVVRNAPGDPHSELLDLLKEDLLDRRKVRERAVLGNLALPKLIERLSKDLFDDIENEPHRILADLPIHTYLTTNPASFMAAALKYVKDNRPVQQATCRWQEDDAEDKVYKQLRGKEESPLVFHLFGDDQQFSNIVLTEDNHLDFLRFVSRDRWRLPEHIRSTMTESVLLFLGYDIRDLTFKVLLKGVVEQIKRRNTPRVAVLQIEPGENYRQKLQDLRLLKTYLEKECSSLKVIDCWISVQDFLIELKKRYLKAMQSTALPA